MDILRICETTIGGLVLFFVYFQVDAVLPFFFSLFSFVLHEQWQWRIHTYIEET